MQVSEGILEVIITALIAPVVLVGLNHYYKMKETRSSETDEEIVVEIDTELDLVNHPFFTRMESLSNTIRYDFNLVNKGKELITKEVLLIKIKTFTEDYRELCRVVDSSPKLSQEEFLNLLMTTFNSAIAKSKNFYKYSETTYSEDEVKCLTIYMSKFNKWSASRNETIAHAIERIGNSRFYPDNKTKMAAMLDYLIGIFIEVVHDAERTLDELNGDLKGLEFNGVKL